MVERAAARAERCYVTRKHYEEIAAIINDAQTKHIVELVKGEEVRVYIARRLALYFIRENSRFDSVRFFEACGV